MRKPFRCGGILPVRVLQVQATNCMTVSFDPVTGFATSIPIEKKRKQEKRMRATYFLMVVLAIGECDA